MRRTDRTAFKAAHDQGLNREELADRFGISTDAVTRIRKELDLPTDKPRRAPKSKKINRYHVKALVDEGFTNVEIAEQVRCHEDSISRIRHELGISHQYRGRTMTPERLDRIKALIDDGVPWKEITRTEGADRDTLAKYFPGTAWTQEQTTEHVRALRAVSHFNRRPKHYDRSKYPSAA